MTMRTHRFMIASVGNFEPTGEKCISIPLFHECVHCRIYPIYSRFIDIVNIISSFPNDAKITIHFRRCKYSSPPHHVNSSYSFINNKKGFNNFLKEIKEYFINYAETKIALDKNSYSYFENDIYEDEFYNNEIALLPVDCVIYE